MIMMIVITIMTNMLHSQKPSKSFTEITVFVTETQ